MATLMLQIDDIMIVFELKDDWNYFELILERSCTLLERC